MATSYSSLLGLALPVQGELTGTWGDVVNEFITQYLDAAVAGTQTISGSQTAVMLSKTTATGLSQAGAGSTGSSQYAVIVCSGNPAGLLTITAPAQSKTYLVVNSTSTSQSVKIVGAGPTTGVTLIAGERALVAWNGSDFVKVSSTAVAAGSSGQVQFNSGGNLAGSTNLTFDGTTLTAAGLTASGTVTLSAGTANGIAYLNGSKVVTTGSALTFDGTNFATIGRVTAVTGSFNGSNEPASGSSVEITYSGGVGYITSYNRTSSAWTDLYFRAGTNTIWSASGSEAMRLTSTGLGIGTSSPAAKLHVQDSTANNGTIQLGGSTFYGTIKHNATGTGANEYNVAAGSGGGHIFQRGGATQFMTDASGNLGLGVTPSAWAVLKGFDVSSSGGFFGYTAQAGLANNTYFNGANWVYKNSAAASFFRATAGNFEWYTAPSGTAGSEVPFNGPKMMLSQVGNFLVGTTTASNIFGLTHTFANAGGSSTIAVQGSNGTGYIAAVGVDTDIGTVTAGGALLLSVASGPAARITSDGNLLVGKTALGLGTQGFAVAKNSGGAYIEVTQANNGVACAYFNQAFNSGSQTAVDLRYNNTQVGTINVTSTATSYNTSSDYRLKEITGPITTSGAYIDSLNPVEGTWKADGSTFVGLIAHEAQEASRTPVATGTKDGEQMQAMDYSAPEIIANMIAELKSLRARVAQLETQGA